MSDSEYVVWQSVKPGKRSFLLPNGSWHHNAALAKRMGEAEARNQVSALITAFGKWPPFGFSQLPKPKDDTQ